MKKRGFTLIELLAVIVILAIIALIATPIVMNVIDKSEKGAAERSAENYIKAVDIAVGTERLDGRVLKGEYKILENGNLCPADTDCTDATDIEIEMSGQKPSSGTIFIENGVATTDSTMGIGDYIVSYDSEKKSFVGIKKEKETNGATISTLCRPATANEVTTGNVPSGNYEYGDEYICELGDGIERIFFVLEDGDNTGLTKGDGSLHNEYDDIGTAAAGEVALIMNQNIGEGSPSWCGQVRPCNAEGALTYLAEQTSEWKVQASLPTYNQIYQIKESDDFYGYIWLYDYLKNSPENYGQEELYWTSTYYYEDDSAVHVVYDTKLQTNDKEFTGGVRPVITISK